MIVATTHTDAGRDIRTIDLTDRFFERESIRDHFSGEPGYLLTTEILAHELVHAVDLRQQYSGTAEFGRVAGLGMAVYRQKDAARVNFESERLNGEGQYEAWQASRSFGIVSLGDACRPSTPSTVIARRSPNSARIWWSTQMRAGGSNRASCCFSSGPFGSAVSQLKTISPIPMSALASAGC